MRCALTLLTGLLLVVLATTSSSAETPNKVAYQGQLLDSSGDPVADGAYFVRFRIYDDPVAGSTLWDSGIREIHTVNGLFHYNLGDSVSLPESVFASSDRYLGIRVGTDSEMTPRTPFTKVAYSDRVESIHNAQAGTVWDNMVFNDPDGWMKARIIGSGGNHDIQLFDRNWLRLNMDAKTGGQGALTFFNANGSFTGGVGTSAGGNGFVELHNSTGTNTIRLQSGAAIPDNTAIFPEGAVNSVEMLDEPGIASDLLGNAGITLSAGANNYEDLVVVTIVLPTSGYIVLTGQSYGITSGTVGANYGWVQIDETEGGTVGNGGAHASIFGAGSSMWTSTSVYWPVFVQRVYFKAAGSHTFRLEACQGTAPPAEVRHIRPSLVAQFFPTSYGSVASFTASPQDHENDVSATSPASFPVETGVRVDLRQLELEAKRKQLEAERAAREASEALLRFERARNIE